MERQSMPDNFYDYFSTVEAAGGSDALEYIQEEAVSLHPEVLPYGGLGADEATVAMGGVFRLTRTDYSGNNAIERATTLYPDSIEDDTSLAA